MPTNTTFAGITDIGLATLEDQILYGVQYFFNWSMLGIGGFYNISIPSSGQYGGARHRLTKITDPAYTNGQVWGGFKREWVWESGVEYSRQPIVISGVYVNGTFHANNATGAYSHYVDYPNGQIVFNSAIATNSVVTAEYSYRYCPFYTSDEPWFQQLQFNSDRVDDRNFILGSGQWDQLAKNRVQFPAVVVEMGRREPSTGLSLGGGQIIKQEVMFHVLTEKYPEQRTMRDIVLGQDNKSIYLFDLNTLALRNRFPLTVQGSIASGAPSYPTLVAEPSTNLSTSGFRWRKATFLDFDGSAVTEIAQNFRWSTCACTIEVEMPVYI